MIDGELICGFGYSTAGKISDVIGSYSKFSRLGCFYLYFIFILALGLVQLSRTRLLLTQVM